MSELYWLTRLDGICVFLVFTSILSVIGIIIFFITWTQSSEDEEYIEIHKESTKWLKISIITFILSICVNIFIPTTKEAMAIWGIGGTIDYIKSNDTVKQIPDKCIKALDKFVDKYMEDKK